VETAPSSSRPWARCRTPSPAHKTSERIALRGYRRAARPDQGREQAEDKSDQIELHVRELRSGQPLACAEYLDADDLTSRVKIEDYPGANLLRLYHRRFGKAHIQSVGLFVETYSHNFSLMVRSKNAVTTRIGSTSRL